MINDYNLILSPLFVLKEAAVFFFVAIPMIAIFWMLSVCIQTMIFSVGIALVSIVPSVLIMNTDYWFIYPMCYPFFVVTARYGQLASDLATLQISYLPWAPVDYLFSHFQYLFWKSRKEVREGMSKILTSICTIMLFAPWTILILRLNDWALESPTADTMILSYAAFMISSGILPYSPI